MADFSTPVRIRRAAFDRLIARIDEAVGEHGVALWLHEDFPFRNLDPIHPAAIDFSNIDIQDDPLEVIENLDQLLYFAFDAAPNDAIISWIGGYDSDLEEEAVQRVEAIRNNMPNLAALWRAKSRSIIPPLVEFTYDVTDSSSDDPRVSLYLSGARISSSDGAPDKSDMIRMRLQLWPSDVRMLMRELSHVWDVHLSSDDRDSEEKQGEEVNNDEDEAG